MQKKIYYANWMTVKIAFKVFNKWLDQKFCKKKTHTHIYYTNKILSSVTLLKKIFLRKDIFFQNLLKEQHIMSSTTYWLTFKKVF